MTEYRCTVCDKKQYTSRTDDDEPCIYCGEKIIKGEEK